MDAVDVKILHILQENCRGSLAEIGKQVGVSPPTILERVKKLEAKGIIRGYQALLDAKKLGKDIAAFVGVLITHPRFIRRFEESVTRFPDILECHHVTGEYTLLLKLRTNNTATLERLISQLRALPGVNRTVTMVVFSTTTERMTLHLDSVLSPPKHTTDLPLSAKPLRHHRRRK